MAHLSARLLGTPEVCLDERPIAGFEYDKVRALFAYLIVEADRPHRRESLAGLLWPERPERAARQSLSQALLVLRRAIADREAAPPFLRIEVHTLQWNVAADSWLDVDEFTTLVDAAQQHPHLELTMCDACIAQLGQSATLYRGHFLSGFSLADCPEFEIWLTLQRERLQRSALVTLDRLAQASLQCGNYEAALD